MMSSKVITANTVVQLKAARTHSACKARSIPARISNIFVTRDCMSLNEFEHQLVVTNLRCEVFQYTSRHLNNGRHLPFWVVFLVVMGKTPQRDCVCKFNTLYGIRKNSAYAYYTLVMNEQKLYCTYLKKIRRWKKMNTRPRSIFAFHFHDR